MLPALHEEVTLPSSGVYPLVRSPDPGALLRFVASRAEIRTRGARRYAAVTLQEAPISDEHDCRLLLFVLRSRSPSLAIVAGDYRVARPSQSQCGVPVRVAAYLTRCNAWRCVDAVSAIDGRIVISAIDGRRAHGAFDVLFASVRLHGAFRADRPSRRGLPMTPPERGPS